MTHLLMIFNPRQIEESLLALRELQIDKVWFENYTEWELQDVVPQVIEETDYDYYLAVSDDGIVRQQALNAVLSLLGEHEVVTGYSNLAIMDMRVNLTYLPLSAIPGETIQSVYHLSEVLTWPTPALPTHFVNMALTGMTRELWQRYPFQVYAGPPGWCSDWMLSKRLQNDGVEMVGARDAFQWHLKGTWNEPDQEERKRLMVDELPKQVRYDLLGGRRSPSKAMEGVSA